MQSGMGCFCCKSEKRHSNKQASEFKESLKIFTYKELVRATNSFSAACKLGEGGFGSVYKARLKDGSIVAAKVLSTESNHGDQEFLNEVNTIGCVNHENLVRLLGYCIEKKEKILVFNYFENGSLSQALLGDNYSNLELSWRERTRIIIGIARGLAFLHEEVKPYIVHRDIKASNILLDKDLTPKIADFGLARLLPSNKSYLDTRVAGTIGYLAPEYAFSGRLTRRADIYSFGVLLLEIVSGKCNKIRLPFGQTSAEEKCSDCTHEILLFQLWSFFERNELVAVVDESLNGQFDAEEACRFLRVVLLCTQDSQKLRPKMSSVIKMLTGEIDVSAETITKPGIITDFMDLKVRSEVKEKKKTNNAYASSTGSSSGTVPSSLSFTSVCGHSR